jgi:hypothetical protein
MQVGLSAMFFSSFLKLVLNKNRPTMIVGWAGSENTCNLFNAS